MYMRVVTVTLPFLPGGGGKEWETLEALAADPKCNRNHNVTVGCNRKHTRKPNVHAGCNRVTVKMRFWGGRGGRWRHREATPVEIKVNQGGSNPIKLNQAKNRASIPSAPFVVLSVSAF